MLLLDQQMLLSVCCDEPSFTFDNDPVREDEVRRVFGLLRWLHVVDLGGFVLGIDALGSELISNDLLQTRAIPLTNPPINL